MQGYNTASGFCPTFVSEKRYGMVTQTRNRRQSTQAILLYAPPIMMNVARTYINPSGPYLLLSIVSSSHFHIIHTADDNG